MPAFSLPTVAHGERIAVQLPVMVHRHRLVVLAVKCVCDEGEHGLPHELADEDHAAPPTFAGLVAHIEAQVHLFERGVEGNRDTLEPHMRKMETNEAYVADAVVEIQFGAMRQEVAQ